MCGERLRQGLCEVSPRHFSIRRDRLEGEGSIEQTDGGAGNELCAVEGQGRQTGGFGAKGYDECAGCPRA